MGLMRNAIANNSISIILVTLQLYLADESKTKKKNKKNYYFPWENSSKTECNRIYLA